MRTAGLERSLPVAFEGTGFCRSIAQQKPQGNKMAPGMIIRTRKERGGSVIPQDCGLWFLSIISNKTKVGNRPWLASFHSAITNSLLVNVAESELWQFFFFLIRVEFGFCSCYLVWQTWRRQNPGISADAKRLRPSRDSSSGGSGHQERVREEVGIQLLFAPVCSCRQRPAQTSDRESAHPAHRGLASRPEPGLPWRWVRPEPTGLGGPTGF